MSIICTEMDFDFISYFVFSLVFFFSIYFGFSCCIVVVVVVTILFFGLSAFIVLIWKIFKLHLAFHRLIELVRNDAELVWMKKSQKDPFETKSTHTNVSTICACDLFI